MKDSKYQFVEPHSPRRNSLVGVDQSSTPTTPVSKELEKISLILRRRFSIKLRLISRD